MAEPEYPELVAHPSKLYSPGTTRLRRIYANKLEHVANALLVRLIIFANEKKRRSPGLKLQDEDAVHASFYKRPDQTNPAMQRFVDETMCFLYWILMQVGH